MNYQKTPINPNLGGGCNFIPRLPVGFPWYFAAFSNILLETFVTNLVSLTRPSLQILGKTQTGVFFGFLVNPQ